MDKLESAAFLSPAWFKEESESGKYAGFTKKISDELEWFNSLYGVEQLKALSGKDLLTRMFYNDSENNRENLCYTLEMNPTIRDDFGSILGGSSFKFGLFYHNPKRCWMSGSSVKPQELTEAEAVDRAAMIRDNLVKGAEEIAGMPEPRSIADYQQMKERVAKHIQLDNIWILKYYKMIFPQYFHSVYSESQQVHMLCALQVQPAESQFVRMGQLALFAKECGIPVELMGRIFADTIGWEKKIYRIGTGRSADMFAEWAADGYCALGFDEIGSLTKLTDEKGKPDRERIISELLEKYDSYNQATASRKANEIIAFMEAPAKETYVVAMNGQAAYGIGILEGGLYEEPAAHYTNRRKTKWLTIFEEPHKMPVFEGRLTSFSRMSDTSNLMLVYRFLYHQDAIEEDGWHPSPSEYDPGISTEQWKDLLGRDDVFGPDWRGVLAAFYLHGPATCTEIGAIYGRAASSVSGTCTNLAKKIRSVTGCPVGKRENGQLNYWPILFRGKTAGKDQPGSIVWKLRPELYDALAEYGIAKHEWSKGSAAGNAWLLLWNPNRWQWEDFDQWLADVGSGVHRMISWNCASTGVKPGDRIYMVTCGRKIRHGIMASGVAASEPYSEDHWDENKKEAGRKTRYIDVELDRIVDYRSEEILAVEKLQRLFPNQLWSPQNSGISVSGEYAQALWELWSGGSGQQVRFHTGYRSGFSRNRIIFGAPGTGKSYMLNQEKDSLLAEGGSFERVTFHPDYSYAHFAGTYKPVPCDDGEGRPGVTYKYVPGPFMRVLVNALRSGRTETPQPCLLIVEEINRANTAAVFGDLFQLLDRDEDDASEYAIQTSEDIRKYLAEELGGSPQDYPELRLPDNMFIWATMNSADQGVFPMDTAFKRRWDFTYLDINHGESGIAGKKVIMGTGSYQRDVEWNELRHALNDRLSALRINEDKLLGPYFLSRRVVPPEGDIDPARFADAFRNKVLMYLYEDAARQKRASVFADGMDVSRYSSVCEAFDEKGVFVFSSEISGRFQLEDEPADGAGK